MEAVHHSAASITQLILLGAVHLRINAGGTGASQRHFSDVGRNKEDGRADEIVLETDSRNIASLFLCSNCASRNTTRGDENSKWSSANNERMIKRCSVHLTEVEMRCSEAGMKTNLLGDAARNLNEFLFSKADCCIFYVA